MKQLLLSLFSGLMRSDSAPSKKEPEGERGRAAELQERARVLLKNVGGSALATTVKVRWNSRMRSTAGMANYALSLVTLNPRLAEFGDSEIDLTLRHELAHLLAKFRAGRRRIAPHGAEWKRACADLGIPNEKRCHTLPLPRRNLVRKHLYRCAHCQTEVPRVRPFRRRVACLCCCRALNHGRYDERFRLVKM